MRDSLVAPVIEFTVDFAPFMHVQLLGRDPGTAVPRSGSLALVSAGGLMRLRRWRAGVSFGRGTTCF